MFRTSIQIRLLSLSLWGVIAGSLTGCWWDGDAKTGSTPPAPPTYSVGGTVSGLTQSGLVLSNGSDSLTVAANTTSFVFATSLAAQTTYSVAVSTQPTGATCTVSNGSGTIAAAAVTNVQVTCTQTLHQVGGTLSGLTVLGLVLANGSDTVGPAANATTFVFPTKVASASTYSVSVSTQPPGLNCTVSAASGTVGSTDVNSVAVTCTPARFHVGGTIAGLSASGLVLANGADTVSSAANATTFTLPTTVASGSTYNVTVQAQPVGLSCAVSNGTGTVATSDINSITVTCTSSAGFTPLAGQLSCPTGIPDRNGTGVSASLPRPTNIVVDANGNAYSYSVYFGVIDKITPAGVVTTLAGQYGTNGNTDGAGTVAQFDGSASLGGVDAQGNLYLSESSNVRRVTPSGVVSTLAGPATGEQGYVDAAGSAARFSEWGLGVAPDGTSYVADYSNHVVRKVSSDGVATTLAGTKAQAGFLDGVGAAAQFLVPQFAAVDSAGTVYVADQNLKVIRKITSDGTVTTLAGTTTAGWTDGPGASAQFYDIRGLAIGPSGSLYVMDQPSTRNGETAYGDKWGAIRQISADGTVKTVVVSSAASPYFASPQGNFLLVTQPIDLIGTAPDGTLYVGSQCAVGTIALP